MIDDESTVCKEMDEMIDLFDNLDGKKQLEFLALIIEKMENGEIQINGKPISPTEIFIDDGYACCTRILDMIGEQ